MDLAPHGISGRGNTTAISGTSSFNPQYGGAVVFDGSSSYANPTINHSYLSSSSCEIFFKLDAIGTSSKGLFGYRANGGYSSPTLGMMWIDMVFSQRLGGSLITTTEVYRSVFSTSSLQAGQVYHAVLNKDMQNGVMQLFLNGVMEASTTFDKNSFAQWTETGSFIGEDKLDIMQSSNTNAGQGWGDNRLSGSVYALRVYDRVLTADEVSHNLEGMRQRLRFPYPIVDNGLIFYVDAGRSNSYPGTGTTVYDVSPARPLTSSAAPVVYSNGAFVFTNSAANYITFPSSPLFDTQTPSVEVWIRTNATTQNGFFFEKGTVNSQYSLFQEGASIQWRHSSDQGLNTLSLTTATYVTASVWAHIVGTYVAGDRRIYVNGVQRAQDAQVGILNTNQGVQQIGLFVGGGYPFNGDIAVVRVYNKVLTQAEITQNFNAERDRFGI